MKHSFDPYLCVLAIDPASHGLGYALFEGPDSLIDWGFRNLPTENKEVHALAFLSMLLRRYKPDVLILEAFDGTRRSHRSPRVLALLHSFVSLASKRRVRCERISRHAVRAVFGVKNKYEIARRLSLRFPETRRSCPPPRRIWQAEDRRVNTFDALALACAYFTVGTEFMKSRKAA